MVRQLFVVLIWLLLIFAAGGIVARWIDGDSKAPILQAIFPVFGIVAVLALGMAVALGAWRTAAVAVLVAAVPVLLAVRSVIPHTVAPRDGDEVIMVSNMEFGGASATTIVAAARAEHVDTLVLAEVTPAAVQRLHDAGLDQLLPHHVGGARTDFRGTLIYSLHPLTEDPATSPDGGALMPAAQVHTPHGIYALRGVHTYAPLPHLVQRWRAGLSELRRWEQAQPRGEPVVLAGDFNSASSMPAFRTMAAGMTDAQRATGSGWARTWPHDKWYPPFVALDHILGRDFQVVSSGTIDVPNTDHLALWSRLRMN